MRTVWSRATQLSSRCHYQPYYSFLAVASRRATTAITRQHSSRGDDFPVFYPSILSTAAGVNTEWRDIKRRDLYASVTDAIQDLKTIEHGQAANLHAFEGGVDGTQTNNPDGREYVQIVFDPFHASVLGPRTHIVASKVLTNPWLRFGLQPIGPTQKLLRFRVPGQKEFVDTDLQFELQGTEQAGKSRRAVQTSTVNTKNGDDGLTAGALRSKIRSRHASSTQSGSGSTLAATREALAVELPLESNVSTDVIKLSSGSAPPENNPPRAVSKDESGKIVESPETGTRIRSPIGIGSWSLSGGRRHPYPANEVYKMRPTVATDLERTHTTKYISFHQSGFDYESPDFLYRGPDLLTFSSQYLEDYGKLDKTSLIDFRKESNVKEVPNQSMESTAKTTPNVKLLNVSIAKLVYRLMSVAIEEATNNTIMMKISNGATELLDKHHWEGLQTTIKIMEERMSALAAGMKIADEPPFPNYASTSSKPPHKPLHVELSEILAAQELDIPTIVPKICLLLGTSLEAPSIRAYDVLLSGLCSLQYYSMAAAVIDSMVECNFVPTKFTTTTLLRYFTDTNDLQGFEYYTRLMGRNKIHQFIGSFSETTSLGLSDQDLPLQDLFSSCNVATYSALINGWLKFGQEKQALIEYHTMIRTGFKEHTQILVSILKYAVEKGNWELGTAVWQNSKKLAPEKKLFYWMLQLCATCKQHRAFAEVLWEAELQQWGMFRNLCLNDFLLNEQDLKSLVRDARTLEKIRPVIKSPSSGGDIARLAQEMARHGKKMRKSGIKPTLQNWISQRLSEVDPELRRRAEEAHPIPTLLTKLSLPA